MKNIFKKANKANTNKVNETNEKQTQNILTSTQKVLVTAKTKFDDFAIVKEEKNESIIYSIMMFSNNEKDNASWTHYLETNFSKEFKKENINFPMEFKIEVKLMGLLTDIAIDNIKNWNSSIQENIAALEEEHYNIIERKNSIQDEIEFFQEEVQEGSQGFASKLYDAQLELEDLEGEERTIKNAIEEEKEGLSALRTSVELL